MGDTVHVTIEAKDQNIVTYMWGALAEESGSVGGVHGTVATSTRNITQKENGNYVGQLSFKLLGSFPSGLYRIKSINLEDNMLNEKFYRYTENDLVKNLEFEVLNPHPEKTDVLPPELVNVTLDKSIYTVGDTVHVTIEAKDQNIVTYMWGALAEESGSVGGVHGTVATSTRNITQKENGNYVGQLSFKLLGSFPSGLYRIKSINLEDNVLNEKFYRYTENGLVKNLEFYVFRNQKEIELFEAKEIALNNLRSYKVSSDYKVNQTAFQNALLAGEKNINESKTIETIKTSFAESKKVIDKIKTDVILAEEILAQELVEAKSLATASLSEYKNIEDYTVNAKALNQAIVTGHTAINQANTITVVESVLTDAKKALDEIKSDALLAEEKLAQELAEAKQIAKASLSEYKNIEDYTVNAKALNQAIVTGHTAIDQTNTINAVKSALAYAKKILDEIKSDALLAEEKLAKASLSEYKNVEDYTENAKALNQAIVTGHTAIDQANTINAVKSALADAKKALDEIKSDVTLRAEILAQAIEAVEIVEESKKQKDLNTAKSLVKKIDDSKEKLTLFNRLEAIQNEIKFEWIKVESTWYYYNEESIKEVGWIEVGTTWYYLDNHGAMKTGWNKVGNTWYYMTSSGATQTGWTKVGNTWYYMTVSGAMQTGWTKVGNTWYYMTVSGAMQTGWTKVGTTWYYMTSSGAMQTGLQEINNKWYYMDENGAMQTGTTHVGDKIYYLYADGSMLQKFGWNKIEDKWYYQNSDAVLETDWNKIGNTWYYMDENGIMQTGWTRVGNTWYYMTGSGAMQTGWTKVGNTWYYMTGSGAMQTGWTKVGNTWYYMSGSGAMQTGWIKLGRSWYYTNSSGAMQTGSLRIGGRNYHFDSSGRMR